MHCRKLNNKINRLHERCLRATYNNALSSFEELLEIDNSVSVHNRNIRCLAIDIMYSMTYVLILWSTSSNYDIRSRRTFTTRPVKTVYYGTGSLSYLAPKVWELIPNNIKSLENLSKFKKAIKNWEPDACPCRLCRSYIPQLGFV